MNRNPGKVRWLSNQNRPNGANISAGSLDPRELFYAALTGNRETRRLARRNLKKSLKADSVIR